MSTAEIQVAAFIGGAAVGLVALWLFGDVIFRWMDCARTLVRRAVGLREDVE